MKSKRILATLVLGALAAAAPPAHAGCQLANVGEFPVTMMGLQPIVDTKMDGADVRLVVDTGAWYSMISAESAKALNRATHRPPEGFYMIGVGGRTDIMLTTVHEFDVGNATVPNLEFIIGGGEWGHGAVGLLGQNILASADDEFDFSKGVVRLMRPSAGCEKVALAYWAGKQPYSAIDLDRIRAQQRKIAGVVLVNGVEVQAVFDTGASTSLLSLRAAARAGLTPDSPGVVPAGATYGLGRGTVRLWIAPIKSFKIGDEEIANTKIQIGDLDMDETEMLVGADFFLAHHVYVANSRDRMYFTYNGGPVFNLQGPMDAAAPAETGNAEMEPLQDAASYARRGAAFISRGDYPHAIADLTHACEMEPTNATYWYQRGRARRGAGRNVAAMADFDEALKRKPDDIETLVARGDLRFAINADDPSQVDLDTAARLAPREANIRLQIAHAYLRGRRFADSVAQFDLWIDANSTDGLLDGARNGRCWARAQWGKELDKALRDCNDAIGHSGALPAYLDSRGLVYLREGKLDAAIADYDAALKQSPQLEWSLYGRGLAKLRKGMTDAGKADIAAAVALRPTIADEARKVGLAP